MVLSSLEMWQKQNVHSHIHLSIEDNEKHTHFFPAILAIRGNSEAQSWHESNILLFRQNVTR